MDLRRIPPYKGPPPLGLGASGQCVGLSEFLTESRKSLKAVCLEPARLLLEWQLYNCYEAWQELEMDLVLC